MLAQKFGSSARRIFEMTTWPRNCSPSDQQALEQVTVGDFFTNKNNYLRY